MSRKTNPEKQARKIEFRKMRAARIAEFRAEQQAEMMKMFTDLIEKTPIEDIEAIASMSAEAQK